MWGGSQRSGVQIMMVQRYVCTVLTGTAWVSTCRPHANCLPCKTVKKSSNVTFPTLAEMIVPVKCEGEGAPCPQAFRAA